jgi:NAD(P)H-hydrate epimerase
VAVKIVICADSAKIEGDAKVNFDICRAMKLSVESIDIQSPDIYRTIEGHIQGCDMLVDAILGTGLSGALKSPLALLVSCLNAHNLPIVAVDIPSGMDCDTGLPLPVCIEAAATVTFAAIKKGFLDYPESRTATGRIFVADIGITPASGAAQ